MAASSHDVVVVGGGLAGSACASALVAAGLDVVVLEKGATVGGRVRTDVLDGFRCDHGFQLLNPAYPVVKKHLDLAALELQQFGAGVVVADGIDRTTLALPWRHPAGLPGVLRTGLTSPLEAARLLKWAAPSVGPIDRLLTRPDEPLGESFDRNGVRGRLRREVLEPFLTGVLAEHPAATSATFARLLVRSFLRSIPGLPAGGMQALSDQVAAPARDRFRFGVTVGSVDRTGGSWAVRTDGEDLSATSVVVAVDPAAVSSLTPLPTVATNGLATWWFTTDDPPRTGDLLVVDARGRTAGPVINTGLVSAAAPSYAPAGRHLIQASTLMPGGVVPTERDVRAHLATMYGAPTHTWDLVTHHEIPVALPAMRAPLDVRQPVSLGDGLFVAGDHRDTASIQGAIVSGRRAAAAVLADR